MSNNKHWPTDPARGATEGHELALRASLAWDLLRAHPLIAGVEDGEDSAGRSKLRLQTPREIVDRAFQIAGIFVDVAVERGEIRGGLSIEDVAKLRGALEIVSDRYASYDEARRTQAQKTVTEILDRHKALK
jgi:hypothetical protein